ncbi:MAG: tripartite tricarboxylate transporter substrate binding protein, partial [Betaproteobacteria bacterium]
ATAVAADAPDFPKRPIRLLASGVGGTGDFTSRLIGPHLTSRLGQPVIVDNRPGGVVPGQILAEAPPDGYTLMMAGEVIWLSPYMRRSVPFDPLRDFAPLMLTVRSPNVLVVHPSLPVHSVQDLIKLAKQKPGELNMASSGVGNSNHLAGAIFKAMAGVEIVGIAYKGAQLALNDVISGRVQLMFATANSSRGHVAAGRLRAIAVTTEQPTRLAPGLPTIASAGLPGYESAAKIGLFARAGTPPAVLGLLHREIAEFLKRADTTERLFKAGVDVVANTPQEFLGLIKSEMKVKGDIIKQAGIRMD